MNEAAIPQHIQRALAAIAEVAPDLAGRIAAFANARPERRPLDGADRALLAAADAFEITFGRQRIRAWSWGRGPVVHLVHGWEGCAADLGRFVRPLVNSGMRVIAHDSIAHGASTGRTSSVHRMAAVLERVVEVTGGHALVAHGMGGTAAAIALARGLEVDRATLVAAPADVSRWPETCFGLRGVAADRARVHAEASGGLTYAALSLSALGPKIRVPILVAHDREDRAVPFEEALTVVRAIRDAGLLATSGLGHRGILRDREVVDEIVDFSVAEAPPSNVRETEHAEFEREFFDPQARWDAWSAA